MLRIEKHIIKDNERFDEICHLSKNLYNYCNYILRQVYLKNFDLIEEYKHLIKSFKIKDNIFYQIKEFDLIKELTKTDQFDYRNLPPQCSQQIIKLLYRNWKSYFSSIREYSKNQSNFLGIPKIPKYKEKDGKNVVILTNQQFTIKDNIVKFCKKINLDNMKTKVDKINQIRIVPQTNCYIVEIVYEKAQIENDLNENLYLGIDLGVNNLATCIDNTGKNNPFIVNGKIVKSMNQYYNKKFSELISFSKNKSSKKIKKLTLKRKNKIDDYFHKTSRFIINYCIENKIKNIVIGYNQNWKDNVNLGKINNQNFCSISHLNLLNQIKYKGEENGINVILIEESYTSKCDALAKEEICYHENYLGKRIKRGLFRSSVNKLINADVNGALNILRKVIQNDNFIDCLLNRGNEELPNRLTPIKFNVLDRL